jgi:thiosulfate/3-mercaptopyruvate sulfurtransferase
MMLTVPSPLVTTDWLAQHLPQVKVIDASWHMPTAQRDGFTEYAERHIPTAQFFDIDAESDSSSDLPHMLPSAVVFTDAIRKLGIRNEDAVVVYDAAGLFSAARLWWMFRVFGHTNVAVLDGGLPKWLREQRPTDSGLSAPAPSQFHAEFQPERVRMKQDVLVNLQTGEAIVLDARGEARFKGEVPEPRAGLRAGHIPDSINIPYTSLLHEDGTMRSEDELRHLLTAADGRPVIASCGSGVTACIIDLALTRIGHDTHAVYDGSWAEWGADAECPVEQG